MPQNTKKDGRFSQENRRDNILLVYSCCVLPVGILYLSDFPDPVLIIWLTFNRSLVEILENSGG